MKDAHMNLARAYGGTQSYRNIGAEAAVTDANPHHLIQLLLQGALDRIAIGKGQMQRGEIGPKGENIGKAITIIAGLRASLNLEQGGEIARNLAALYEYAELRLLEANLKNDAGRLDEAAQLLGVIKGAWDGIAPKPAP